MSKRRRIYACAWLPLAAVVGLTPAWAQTVRSRETYFAPDPAIPELASDYLRGHPGDAMEVITFTQQGREPVLIYYGFGPAARSPQGVCRFTATQIFPHRADDGTVTWDSTPLRPGDRVEPPFAMVAAAPAPCPRQSEDTYTVLEAGITDAEFTGVLGFWKDIAGSQEKFDKASVLLPLIISPRAADRFTSFRTAVFRTAGQPVQFRAMFRSGVEAYELAFAESSAEAPNYFLSISKTEAGFQVLNFQTRY